MIRSTWLVAYVVLTLALPAYAAADGRKLTAADIREPQTGNRALGEHRGQPTRE